MQKKDWDLDYALKEFIIYSLEQGANDQVRDCYLDLIHKCHEVNKPKKVKYAKIQANLERQAASDTSILETTVANFIIKGMQGHLYHEDIYDRVLPLIGI